MILDQPTGEMVSGQLGQIIRYIHRIAAGQANQLSDFGLLDRFSSGHDQEAFGHLVQRHGRLVLGTCRRVTQDWHAAEDCFQAVFLVLATKAGSLRPTESLGPWLHAVAMRVALKARTQAAKRRIRERKAAVSISDNQRDDLAWRELGSFLDDAIAHLPSKHRIPFVLCYMQGRTVKETAEELGQPIGTVAARLARAREQLRTRLIRRGITLSAAGLATALSENMVTASVPTSLASGTIKGAILVAAGRAAVAAFIPNPITALMAGAMRTMVVTKMKTVAGIVVLFALGTTILGYHFMAAKVSEERDNAIKARDQSVGAKSQVADDRPGNRVPSELPARGAEGLRDIPLLLLRRYPIKIYRVAAGDTLGIVVDDVLGDSSKLIHVGQGENADNPPSLGCPIPVRDDGTISMPQVPPIMVDGMSLSEVEDVLRQVYTVKWPIVRPDKFSAVVTLWRKRTYGVTVIRQDSSGSRTLSNGSMVGSSSLTIGAKHGTGQVLQLPQGENDVLTALAKTGGMPGIDAMNEVVIQRWRTEGISSPDAQGAGAKKLGPGNSSVRPVKQIIRIPLELRPGEPFPFTEKDIILENGDIVFVAAREMH